MKSYAIVYRSGSHAEIWAWITEVPADVDHAGVVDALESWSRWPSWRARVGLGGSIAVMTEAALRRSKRLAEAAVANERGLTMLSWADLAPVERTITVPVDGALYARVTRAAQINGISLRRYVTDALDKALA